MRETYNYSVSVFPDFLQDKNKNKYVVTCFYFFKGVLPKSCNPDHIRENIDIFSFQIPEEDVFSLNSLDKGKHYCWNPVAIL